MNEQCRLSFVGKFEIPRKHICQDPDAIYAILSQGIIIAVETDFYKDALIYTMFSPQLFRELPENEMVPFYEITVTELYSPGDEEFIGTRIEADEV